jgi:pyrroline-5-carboxylate reductase
VADLGFIGTGVIAEAVITGLLASTNAPETVVVSPRNAVRAAGLASKYPQVKVAKSNQAVIDACKTVCLSIRPQIADQVLGALVFPEDITVVSFVPTYTAPILQGLIGPVRKIVRMIPLPPSARCLGPVLIFPADTEVEKVFGGIGTIIRAETADQFHALWATTSMLAPYFGLLGSVANWLRDRGVPAEDADSYVAAMFHSIADTGLKVRGEGFEEITIEHATPGGLNEQMLRELTRSGSYDNVSRGLSLIFERLNGRADLDDTIG